MSGRRPERIAEQIKEEVALIIGGDLEDPRVSFITVTDARVSPDLRHAKIFVTAMGTKQQAAEAVQALNHAAGFIRHQLGSALRVKRIPELRFVYDETSETAARIEELLSEEVEKAKARNEEDESEN